MMLLGELDSQPPRCPQHFPFQTCILVQEAAPRIRRFPSLHCANFPALHLLHPRTGVRGTRWVFTPFSIPKRNWLNNNVPIGEATPKWNRPPLSILNIRRACLPSVDLRVWTRLVTSPFPHGLSSLLIGFLRDTCPVHDRPHCIVLRA